jgi:hypothetical protein
MVFYLSSKDWAPEIPQLNPARLISQISSLALVASSSKKQAQQIRGLRRSLRRRRLRGKRVEGDRHRSKWLKNKSVGDFDATSLDKILGVRCEGKKVVAEETSGGFKMKENAPASTNGEYKNSAVLDSDLLILASDLKGGSR